MIFDILVLFTIIQRIFADYVFYPEIQRHCIRIYNCPPDHGIQPCLQDHQKDLCTKCPAGKVQPEYISSTGNYNTTDCFEPHSECLAKDVTYRRYPVKAFCKPMSGCKCNTAKCFYGDPCLCQRKPECGVGQELNETGDCVNCKTGFEKETKGCGPCLRTDSREILNSYSNRISTVSVLAHGTSIDTVNNDTQDETVMIIIMVLLGLTVLILGTVIIVLSRKREMTMLGACWTNNNLQNGDLEINPIFLEQHLRQQQPLLEQNNESPQGQNINRDKPNAGISNGNSEKGIQDSSKEVNQNSINQEPRESVSSGFHDDEREYLEISSDNVMESIEENHSTYEDRENLSNETCNRTGVATPIPNLDNFKKVNDNTSYLSEGRSPVTTESEPHFQVFLHSNRVSDTTGYPETFQNEYNTATPESIRSVSSFKTEELNSALEEHPFKLKGLCNSIQATTFSNEYSTVHETVVKEREPTSWSSNGSDSGIHSELLF